MWRIEAERIWRVKSWIKIPDNKKKFLISSEHQINVILDFRTFNAYMFLLFLLSATSFLLYLKLFLCTSLKLLR